MSPYKEKFSTCDLNFILIMILQPTWAEYVFWSTTHLLHTLGSWYAPKKKKKKKIQVTKLNSFLYLPIKGQGWSGEGDCFSEITGDMNQQLFKNFHGEESITGKSISLFWMYKLQPGMWLALAGKRSTHFTFYEDWMIEYCSKPSVIKQ